MVNKKTRGTKVRLSEKYSLTVRETAELFGIGQHVIRQLAAIPGNNYSMKIGTKTLIKSDKFREYLDGRKQL